MIANLQFGCLSSRYFYQCIQNIYENVGKHTSPPVSLVGQVSFIGGLPNLIPSGRYELTMWTLSYQLLWREFFYTVAFGTPNFDQMKGNKICKQVYLGKVHACAFFFVMKLDLNIFLEKLISNVLCSYLPMLYYFVNSHNVFY